MYPDVYRRQSVYCDGRPVVFGIRPFNSDSEATVVIFSRQAIIIAPIKDVYKRQQ